MRKKPSFLEKLGFFSPIVVTAMALPDSPLSGRPKIDGFAPVAPQKPRQVLRQADAVRPKPTRSLRCGEIDAETGDTGEAAALMRGQ